GNLSDSDWQEIVGEIKLLKSEKQSRENHRSQTRQDTAFIWQTVPIKRSAPGTTKEDNRFIRQVLMAQRFDVVKTNLGEEIWSSLRSVDKDRIKDQEPKQIIIYRTITDTLAVSVLYCSKMPFVLDWHADGRTAELHDLPRGLYVLNNIGQG